MKTPLQKITLLSALLLSTLFATAQWSSIAPVPAGLVGNDGAVSFTIGNTGYLVAGSGTDNVFAFDTISNAWTNLGAVPAAMGHAFGMAFQVNGKGYVVGGDTSGIPVATVWEFDPTQMNPWTQKNNFPGGARDAGFGFAIGNYGYVGGGNDNMSLYTDIWKYDPPTDSWTMLQASLPVNGIIFPVSFVIGTRAYISTGGVAPNGVNEIKNMWCLDGTNDSLSVRNSFAGVGRQAAFAFSNNNYGYIGGGQTNYTTNYYDMWKYDPGLDQWTPAPSAPLLGAAWSSAFVIGNNAYAGLGAKFVGTGLTGNLNFYKFGMSLVTATHDLDNSISVSVYPNPSSDNIKVVVPGVKKFIVEIYSVSGNMVTKKEIHSGESISVATLAAGIYTIKCTSKDLGTVVTRIAVTR
jgi:hypothetical protein